MLIHLKGRVCFDLWSGTSLKRSDWSVLRVTIESFAWDAGPAFWLVDSATSKRTPFQDSDWSVPGNASDASVPADRFVFFFKQIWSFLVSFFSLGNRVFRVGRRCSVLIGRFCSNQTDAVPGLRKRRLRSGRPFCVFFSSKKATAAVHRNQPLSETAGTNWWAAARTRAREKKIIKKKR